MLRAAAWITLAVVLAPVVAAQPGHHVLQYHQFILNDRNEDGILPEYAFSLEAPHSWTHAYGESVLELHLHYIVEGGIFDQSTTHQLQWNGEPLAACSWRIDATQAPGERNDRSRILACPLPGFAVPGPYTVAIEAVATDGQPILNASISMQIRQTETIEMDLDVNITPEIMANLAWFIWAGYFLLTRFVKSPMLAILSSVVGFGILALPVNETQFLTLITAQGIVLFYDTARLITRMDG